jgi:hypothetical protein
MLLREDAKKNKKYKLVQRWESLQSINGEVKSAEKKKIVQTFAVTLLKEIITNYLLKLYNFYECRKF